MTSLPAGARCGVHPKTAAIGLCTRCGAFVCGDCVRSLAARLYCQSCLALLTAPKDPALPHEVRRAVALAAIAVLTPPTAVAAWIHNRIILRRLLRDGASARAQEWAEGAVSAASAAFWISLLGWAWYGLSRLVAR